MSEPRQLLGPGLLSFCRNSLQRTVIGSPRLLGTLEYWEMGKKYMYCEFFWMAKYNSPDRNSSKT